MASFQFNLTVSLTLELFRLINSQEHGSNPSVEHLRQTLYSQLPQAFTAGRHPVLEVPVEEPGARQSYYGPRFSPYPAKRPSPPPPPRKINACQRGGRKSLANDSRQWIEADEPFIEKNTMARAFLRQFTVGSKLTVGEKACSEWIEELKKTLILGKIGQNNEAEDISLSNILNKCSAEGNRSIFQTFRQVLAQMELAKKIDK